MTVPANEYEPVVVQSADVSVIIPISWPYLNDVSNLFIIQQDLTTGDTRNSDQGGFTFTKNADGTEITVQQFVPFAGNNTAYTVNRRLPVTQTYDLTEQTAINSQALETALDQTVRYIQDSTKGSLSNVVTSPNPFEVPNKINRATQVLGFDVNGDPIMVGNVTDLDDISQAVSDAEASAQSASADADSAEASATSAQASADQAQAIADALPQNNATNADPTSTDDANAGYAENSLWVNTDTDNTFVCADPTVGSAVWQQTNLGAIPNLVSAVKTNQFTTASTTYVDIPDMTATISPKSIDSKIKISVSVVLGSSDADVVYCNLLRNGTIVVKATDGTATDTNDAWCAGGTHQNEPNRTQWTKTIEFIDEPNSTAPQTYKVQIKKQASGSAYVNRWGLNDGAGGISTLVVEDVASSQGLITVNSIKCMQIIDERPISNASQVDFKDLDGRPYMIDWDGIVGSVDDADGFMRFSSDNGSNFHSTNYRSDNFIYSNGSTLAQRTTDSIKLIASTSDANGSSSGYIKFAGFDSSDHKTVAGNSSNDRGDQHQGSCISGSYIGDTDPINAIRIYLNSGTIVRGTIRLWGLVETFVPEADESVLVQTREYTGATDTLVLADANQQVRANSASANVCTIPLNSSVNYPIDTFISILQQGVGETTIQADTGVTLNGVVDNSVALITQYSTATVQKVGANEWVVYGGLQP